MKDTVPRDDEEVTLATLEAWLKHAQPGDRFEYHRGSLANDRERVMNIPAIGTFAHVYVEPVNHLAKAMWRYYEQGKVTLVQEKVGPETFRYLAVKTRRPPVRAILVKGDPINV